MNKWTIYNSAYPDALRYIEEQVKDTYFGFVYACEYGDYIKIGSTNQPYTRLLTLIRGAEKYGETKIGMFAISPKHTNYRENEKYLHSFLSDKRKEGTELFSISLIDATNVLGELELRDDTELLRKKSDGVFNGLKNYITGQTPTLSFKPEAEPKPEPRKDIITISNVQGYVDEDNKVWLNAEDVAIGFGFTQEKNGVRFVRWERFNKYLSEFGFSPLVGKETYIPENMVYRLGFKANNDAAIKFQTFLADEVLPSIRKHGAYMTEQTIEKALTSPDFLIQLATQLKEEKEKRIAAEQESQRKQLVIDEQQPKVVFADAVVGSKSSCLIGELAKILTQNGYKIGQNRLFEWLRNNHYLGSRGEFYNIPMQQYIDNGLFELKKTTHSENGVMRSTVTTKVTGKGQQYFVNKFLNKQHIINL